MSLWPAWIQRSLRKWTHPRQINSEPETQGTSKHSVGKSRRQHARIQHQSDYTDRTDYADCRLFQIDYAGYQKKKKKEKEKKKRKKKRCLISRDSSRWPDLTGYGEATPSASQAGSSRPSSLSSLSSMAVI